jgi:small-conductance mechanosensitive channel
VQYVVVATATIVALDQVGIDVALLIALAVALTAAVLIALAVAFALGARSHVSNLVGIRAARDQLATGMRIQIGDVEGEIVEISASQVALETPRGKVLVPGRMLDEAIVCLLTSPTEMDQRGG